MLRYFFVFALLLPLISQAQEPSTALPKGKRGGYLVKGDDKVYFEIIDDGTKVSFFPCDSKGDILTPAPVEAEITIVYLATAVTHFEPDVKLTEGAFTIYPPREMPIYIYAIGYGPKENRTVVKFRDPAAPRPR